MPVPQAQPPIAQDISPKSPDQICWLRCLLTSDIPKWPPKSFCHVKPCSPQPDGSAKQSALGLAQWPWESQEPPARAAATKHDGVIHQKQPNQQTLRVGRLLGSYVTLLVATPGRLNLQSECDDYLNPFWPPKTVCSPQLLPASWLRAWHYAGIDCGHRLYVDGRPIQ